MNVLRSGFTELRQEEMDRLLDRLLDPHWKALVFGEWIPKLDVSETKDALVVEVETPGIEAKDIRISLEGEVLSIRGEKKQHREDKDDKDERYHRVERSWGSFMRSVRLPFAVQRDELTAAFKNGVLTVTLPKAPVAEDTPIEVKAA
jgi:HSP20 family protein